MSDVSNRSRVSAGVPTGGEFAREAKAENGDLTVDAPVPQRFVAQAMLYTDGAQEVTTIPDDKVDEAIANLGKGQWVQWAVMEYDAYGNGEWVGDYDDPIEAQDRADALNAEAGPMTVPVQMGADIWRYGDIVIDGNTNAGGLPDNFFEVCGPDLDMIAKAGFKGRALYREVMWSPTETNALLLLESPKDSRRKATYVAAKIWNNSGVLVPDREPGWEDRAVTQVDRAFRDRAFEEIALRDATVLPDYEVRVNVQPSGYIFTQNVKGAGRSKAVMVGKDGSLAATSMDMVTWKVMGRALGIKGRTSDARRADLLRFIAETEAKTEDHEYIQWLKQNRETQR